MGELPTVLQAVAALVPSAGVAFLFWLAIRAIIGADRRERAALAQLDAEAAAAARREAPADRREAPDDDAPGADRA